MTDRSTIGIRVQPGAKRNAISRVATGSFRISVTAPPREGRANEAVIRFLAEALGVRRSQVSVVSGRSSRDKVIAVDGLSPSDVSARLEEAVRR